MDDWDTPMEIAPSAGNATGNSNVNAGAGNSGVNIQGVAGGATTCSRISSTEMNGLSDPFEHVKKGTAREVGSQAVWSLSSCKPGFGVDQLRDGCLDTYWQSDGPQPHLVNIQFPRKIIIQDVCIYADYKLDESYTPQKISIRAGNHFQDLQEIELLELNEPTGWVQIGLKDSHDMPVRAFLIQIAVLSNHQNGRDTHIRQIKVHSPVESTVASIVPFPMNFSTVTLSQHATIR